METKLKPCAHCGCEAEEKPFDGIFYYLRCSNEHCFDGAHWVAFYDREKLYEAWNRRANDANN